MDQIQNQLLLVLLIVGLLFLGGGYLMGRISGKQLAFAIGGIVLVCIAAGLLFLLAGL